MERRLQNEKDYSWKIAKKTQWFVPLDGVSGVVERVNSVMKDATTVRVVVWLMNSYWQYWKEVFLWIVLIVVSLWLKSARGFLCALINQSVEQL